MHRARAPCVHAGTACACTVCVQVVRVHALVCSAHGAYVRAMYARVHKAPACTMFAVRVCDVCELRVCWALGAGAHNACASSVCSTVHSCASCARWPWGRSCPGGSCSLFRKGYLWSRPDSLTLLKTERLKAIRDEVSCSAETSVLFQQCPAMGH